VERGPCLGLGSEAAAVVERGRCLSILGATGVVERGPCLRRGIEARAALLGV
jgi:hypothetical protein